MRVRAAVPEDAQAIAEVQVESWRAAYAGLLPAAYLDGLSVDRRTEVWREVLQQPELDVFVSEAAEGRVVGFASLGRSRDADASASTGELSSLYVLPAVWSLGYGRALMDAVLTRARSRGFDRLTLWVLTSNRRARRFYQAAGLAPDGAEKREVRAPDVVLEECRYAMDLDQA